MAYHNIDARYGMINHVGGDVYIAPTELTVRHCLNHDLDFCSYIISRFQKLQDAFCESCSLRAWMVLIEQNVFREPESPSSSSLWIGHLT